MRTMRRPHGPVELRSPGDGIVPCNRLIDVHNQVGFHYAPDLVELVTRLDIHRHAHAMLRPLPGRLWGGGRAPFEAGAGNIRFAHADVSGLSLFEEANHRGVLAAERTLARLGVSFASSL